MNWVDQKSYFGPNRRTARRALRLVERRREDLAHAPLSTAAAARRLMVWSLDVEAPAKATFMAEPLAGVASLLRFRGAHASADRIDRLVWRLRKGESGRQIGSELRRVADRLASAAPRA